MARPVDYQNGKPVYDQATPGVAGAVKDFVGAVSGAVAPKSITQIKARNDEAEDEAVGRMRNAQSTDRDNSYSY